MKFVQQSKCNNVMVKSELKMTRKQCSWEHCETRALFHKLVLMQWQMPEIYDKSADSQSQASISVAYFSCRCITGCLRPTNVDSLYVLAGIAPPGVRRSVASRTERRRQADDTRHPCHNQQPAPSRLKSREELPSWSPATVTTSSNSKANIMGGTTICKATPSKAANPN